MVKYRNTTLISRGIKKIKKFISNVHISVGYKGPILAKHLIEENVNTIVNTNNKGNAWWLFNTIFKNLNEPIFVLTCDNVTNINFNKISDDYHKKKSPLCMIIPTKPIEGVDGDYIFSYKNVIKKLSRKKKSNLYCTGIQVLNPKKINEFMKPVNDFNLLWKKLINKKKLLVSDIQPKNWFTIDNINNYKMINKLKLN